MASSVLVEVQSLNSLPAKTAQISLSEAPESPRLVCVECDSVGTAEPESHDKMRIFSNMTTLRGTACPLTIAASLPSTKNVADDSSTLETNIDTLSTVAPDDLVYLQDLWSKTDSSEKSHVTVEARSLPWLCFEGDPENAGVIWKMPCDGTSTNSSGTKLSMGFAVIRPHQTLQLHRHRAAEIYLFLKGRGTMRIGTQTFDVQPGESYFVPNNCVHSCEASWGESVVFLYIFPWRPFGEVKYDFSAVAEESETQCYSNLNNVTVPAFSEGLRRANSASPLDLLSACTAEPVPEETSGRIGSRKATLESLFGEQLNDDDVPTTQTRPFTCADDRVTKYYSTLVLPPGSVIKFELPDEFNTGVRLTDMEVLVCVCNLEKPIEVVIGDSHKDSESEAVLHRLGGFASLVPQGRRGERIVLRNPNAEMSAYLVALSGGKQGERGNE